MVDGVLYALGGHGATRNGAISTVEEYNIAEQSWGVVARDMQTRDSMGCTTCRGSIVVVGGYLWNQDGSNNLRRGSNTSASSSSSTTTTAAAAAASNGSVTADWDTAAAGIAALTPSTPSTAAPSLPVKVPTGSVEGYCPATKQWTTYPSLPAPRFGLACVQVDDKIYAIGGESDVLEPVNTMFVLEPGAAAWRETAGMRTPRARPGAAVVDGLIYVCGGSDGSDTQLNTVEVRD